MADRFAVIDGNEAAARVAHKTNEVIAIYPITPASPMGEHADAWSAAGRKNLWGEVPEVIEMQSEGGAAGAVHGSLQAGALTTTFTASQGLLLMIPNMFKIAGELTPTVFHIAARSVATHALSIFGDHSDVMAARGTGWAFLASGGIQEVQDLALIAQAATLRTRIPFLHFFDGFRTSHEVNKVTTLSDEQIRAMIDEDLIHQHRARALNPSAPVLRGSAQNPDVFFQAREAINPFYDRCSELVQETMDEFAKLTGRQYQLFDYVGSPQAERVVVLMGSGVGAAEEAVRKLNEMGEPVGLLKVRLYRPFDMKALVKALPDTVKTLAVLDRTKEPGAPAEPLFLDVLAAVREEWQGEAPRVIGGRFGLSSKEFTPAMVKGVLDEAKKEDARRRFTVGIVDDVTHLSLDWDDDFVTEPDDVTRAVFYGLGSDGTVGASKNSVKIIGEETEMYAQGYFVYDSKKAGSTTVSHLRFGPRPIESTYLIRRANFVACHQFNFLEKMDVLETACEGATFLLNSPFSAEEVWDQIPAETQQGIIDKKLKFYVVDGYKVAKEAGMGTRINTVMQTCFFAISGVLPKDDAIAQIKEAIRKTYGKRGQSVLDRNFAAVDASLGALSEVKVPGKVNSTIRRHPGVPEIAPDFVQRVTRIMIEGKGDLLPVSAMPVDGTFPTGTTKWEKRSIAQEIPIWDPDICIQCALCSLVCPHAAIRMNAWDPKKRDGDRPEGFLSMPWKTKEHAGLEMAIQVAPDDCTGCGVCVDVCPAHSKEVAKHKAINMEPKREHLERERANFDYFSSIEFLPRQDVKLDSIKGSQLGEPLFEFSGACAGCGETPYIKLATQLFGDRMIIANATGCSSIYGGNLPTTPYTTNAAGHGPAWNNSLFEDNAEFGIGMRLAVEAQTSFARNLVQKLSARLGGDLAGGLLEGEQQTEMGIAAQRARVAELKEMLQGEDDLDARDLLAVADSLVRRSVWIVGGDGWAYDIGFGGLDHVIASGRNVNILVLDTEVYSNTGGQASKATPRAAVAKFAAGGKPLGKKDLGMIAMAYGNCYVAQVALGANPSHTIRVMKEAEAYDGPSLIIAYSHCIAHGIDMSTSMSHQKEGVKSGFISLYHYNPDEAHSEGSTPFKLDSKQPTIPFRDFALKEARFGMLVRSKPERAQHLFAIAQSEIEQRYKYYKQLAGVERTLPADEGEDADRLSKEPKE